MRVGLKAAVAVAGIAFSTLAGAGITFYEGEGFHGRNFTADGAIRNLDRTGFNDRASSAVVDHGRWQVCEDAYFKGRCKVLRPGEYASLRHMGLNNKISSMRPFDDHGYNRRNEAQPPVSYGYGNERRYYEER